MSIMKPDEIEVYTEVLAAIAADANEKGNVEVEDEAFELSLDIYKKKYDFDYVKEKVAEFRRILNG